MAGPSNRLPTTLRRRGFAFNFGAPPGFDPSHPLAENLVLSTGVISGLPTNLLTRAKATPTSLVYKIDSILGPVCTYVSASSQALFSAPTTVQSPFTIACFFKPTTSLGSADIFSTDTSNLAGYGLVCNSLVVSVIFNTSFNVVSSGITLTLNSPYFIIASLTNGGTINFAVTNLRNGKIQTKSIAASSGTLTGGSGTCEIGNGANAQADGSIGCLVWSASYFSLSECVQIARDPWAFWFPTPQGALAYDPAFVRAPSGGTAYTISPAGGTFAISGTAAAFVRGINILPAGGSYAITGTAITPSVGLPLAVGSYAYSGTAATFPRKIGLTLGAGSYTFTGTAIVPAVGMPAAGGSYVITGAAVTLGIGITPAGGAYVWNGTAATLTLVAGATLIAGSGSFNWSGIAASFAIALSIKTVGGSYLYTGANVTLTLSSGPAVSAAVHAPMFFSTVGMCIGSPANPPS